MPGLVPGMFFFAPVAITSKFGAPRYPQTETLDQIAIRLAL
jgi:hypothetical protein